MSNSVFLSYARADDCVPDDKNKSFVTHLYSDLKNAGFDVWFDRVSMPSRNLTFHQEIRDAIAAHDRFVLVVGPNAVTSDYVRQEWQFAWREADKVVTPILRHGDYPIVPDELRLLHCEDFRDDAQYRFHFENLERQLREPPPLLGKLIAVPSLPAHYLTRNERLQALRDALRADLDRPVVIGGAAARVGMHGMAGIGKSVLSAALVRDRKVREAFPDGIIWVGLGFQPDLRALLQRVHHAMRGVGAIDSEQEGKQRLKELLTDKAVLIVLDDAWRRGDVDAFDVLGTRCRALVTTRDAGLLTALGGAHHVVELLTDDEARHLLATAAGIQQVELSTEATAVILECGRLPLAVALCGALFRRGMPWTSVLSQLEQARIDHIADRHAVELQHRSIWHAIHVSVEALTPAERARFLELGVFPSDESTPQSAVATLWEHTSHFDEWNTVELLTTLVERSLIISSLATPASVSGPRRFAVHDLVFDYLQKSVSNAAQLHAQLLAAYARKCPFGWSSGPNDGYFYEHAVHHALLAQDFTCATDLTCRGFLDRKAELLGDTAALPDARAVAEALAAAGESRYEDLKACTYAYCSLAERIRAAPEALEVLARLGDADRIAQAAEAETDPIRRGSLLLASSALLTEHGHTRHAREFWERGATLLREDWSGENSNVLWNSNDTTEILARSLLKSAEITDSDGYLEPTSHVGRFSSEDRHDGVEPKLWVPWHQSLVLSVTSVEQEVFWKTGLCLGLDLVALAVTYFVYREFSPANIFGSLLVGGALSVPVVFFFMHRGNALRRADCREIEIAMCALLAGSLKEPQQQRPAIVLRALRLHSLLQKGEIARQRPWSTQLCRLVTQDFSSDLPARRAALWLIAAADFGEHTASRLRSVLRASPVNWVREVYGELLRRRELWRHNSSMLRFARALAEDLNDPQLLLQYAHLEPASKSDSRHSYSSTEIRRHTNTLLELLSKGSTGLLARSILVSLCDNWRRPVLLTGISDFYSRIAGFFETPLSRLELVWFLPLFLLVVGPDIVFLVPVVAWALFVVALTAALGVLARQYDAYGLSTLAAIDRPAILRTALLARLTAGLAWHADFFQTRRAISTVVAQATLRHEFIDLHKVPARCVELALTKLGRMNQLSRISLLLNVMSSRRLLDAVVRISLPTIPVTQAVRRAEPDQDLNELRRLLPLMPARYSFCATLFLSFLMISPACAVCLWQAGGPRFHAIYYLFVFVTLLSCTVMCVLQHSPFRERRDKPDHFAMKGMGLLVALMILFLVAFFGNSYLSPRNALNSVVNGEQSAPFSPDPRVFLFSLLWPVLIVQVLVPMLIVFWSGSDLFYPTSTHLGVRRLVCMILGIVASVVLGWITSLFL